MLPPVCVCLPPGHLVLVIWEIGRLTLLDAWTVYICYDESSSNKTQCTGGLPQIRAQNADVERTL